ncbi:hypothetical protein FRC04_000618 [Tulasnella sp. 424]|nr:hypothetical protein FRC04_000618 [Tulasnella sp. 424]
MTDISQPPLRRHESFYFFDGNICLLSRGIVFRVFKSLLAAESEVFKDMFVVGSDGQAEGQSLYEGVPLISLDDDPEDLAHLFRFLWKPPTTSRDDSKDFQTGQTYYRHYPDYAAKVIALARKCHLPSYLPSAFYFLASEESGSAISVRGPYALNAEDVRRVHMGKMAIQKLWWDFVKESDDTGLKNPASMAHCYDWENASSSAMQSRMSALQAGAQDPMMHWISRKTVYTRACHLCKGAHNALCEEFGKKLFNALPSIFDLERKIKAFPIRTRMMGRRVNPPSALAENA